MLLAIGPKVRTEKTRLVTYSKDRENEATERNVT